MADTLHVHFYAGPGVGKSTTNALTFGALKKRGRNVELIHEFAKVRAWEGTLGSLDQREAAWEQLKQHARLEGKVEATLSDTSILYGCIYGKGKPEDTPAFRHWLLDEYRRMKTLNIYLVRNPDRFYNEAGRGQTLEEAMKIDNDIQDLLVYFGLKYHEFKVDKDDNYHVGEIVQLIESHL